MWRTLINLWKSLFRSDVRRAILIQSIIGRIVGNNPDKRSRILDSIARSVQYLQVTPLIMTEDALLQQVLSHVSAYDRDAISSIFAQIFKDWGHTLATKEDVKLLLSVLSQIESVVKGGQLHG